MSKPVPIWKLPSFSSIFGDPFIGGTALDGGHPVDSANAILYALHHITTFCQETEETSEQVLSNQKSKYFSPDNVAIIQKLMKYIDSYRQIASKQIKESNEFLPFLSEFSTMLDNLQVSECFLIPGGWDGKNDSGSLTYIVERTSEVLYSFVTCNGGCSGIEFHPSSSTENGKLKFKTCIRLNNIASKKIKDKAFWSTMFSLWLKQPAGEYQRGEVIYDVLLPWLSGGLLPTALAKTEKDHRAEWRTPCKSGGSATYKSLWESVRYLGLHMGLAPNVLKQLSFCVRQTLLQTIGRDLCVMGDMSAEFQMYKVPNPDERTIRDILTEVLPINSSGDAMNSIAPFENKVIALYFSGSWCGPCQQFTPLLKEFYTAVKREGKPFEIVFISHDRSIDEFNQYYSKMPWHALPYNQIGRKAAQELVEKYQVSGIPSLIFLRNLDDESILASDGRSLVMKDPTGSKYPWEKGKVNKSSVGDSKEQEEEEDEKRTMSSADLKLIRFACEQTARSAKKAWSKNMVCLDEISKLKKTIENLLASAHSLPPGPDVVLERSSLLPPIMNIQDSDCQMEVDGFSNAELLSGSGMDSLAGKESQNKVTDIPNTLNLPNSVDSIDQALVALVRYTSVVDQLLVRAGDASTSSRLASRYQIIELIGTLFSKVLPAPDPSSVAIAFEYAKASEEWEEEVDNENEHKQQQTTAPTNTNPSKTNLVATPIKSNSDADANKAKNADAGADAASAAKRQEAALNLMAAYPQYEFDVIVGALEVSGDSVSIAANLIFGKDNAAASKLIASKRAAAATATRQLDSKVSGNLTTSSAAAAAAAVAIEEESLYSNYYDTFGPNRDVATQFREDLLFDKMGNNSSPTCIWAYPTTKDAQVRMLRAVHKLLAIYGSMWQAIEIPSREYDAERSCVTMCALAIFDILIRMPAKDSPLVVSSLLSRDGGYAISTAVCQNNRSLDEMSISMQLHHPTTQQARANALDYLSGMRRSCSKTLFVFRQPQKIEVRKYSASCTFLKRLLHKCGYPLIPRDVQRPPTEIEALCNWMFEPETPLAKNQPEYGLLRDMAALCKFLLTMQTREAELIRRRMDSNRFLNYSFTFEEGGRKSSWSLDTKIDLRWEVVGYRGAPDKDCADVDVFFGGRTLFFGEGLVIQSPVNVSTYIDTPMPTEDDVLHSEELPDFSGTLSRDESEMLFSYLVVDYARIPLVLNFFAEKDRVTYLINEDLQQLLLATLFESGPFVPNRERKSIRRVPERMSYSQKQREDFARMQDARLPPNHRVLGTPQGLLLNEMRNAPSATLNPLISMLMSTIELMTSSVHSPDATFILFMTTLAIDVQSYVDQVIELSTLASKTSSKGGDKYPFPEHIVESTILEQLTLYRSKLDKFLHGPLEEALEKWRREAEEGNDMPTACVIHSYLALIWFNVRHNDLESDDAESKVTSILGSLSFVRNWHGFGMGTLRSNMLGSANTENGSERLMRFMQAHGIDTSHVKKETLTKFCKGGRPLYMRVGREVVRAPTFAAPDMREDQIPPADVPEYRIFKMAQKHAGTLVHWLKRSQPHQLDRQLNKIMSITLRNPTFVYNGWISDGYTFVASSLDLRFSPQTSEVLWRNDELRPVPDSMVQFNDYDSMFGREPLHCGIVKRQSHRLWVHLVGKEYDLLEWDEPAVTNMGIGMPTSHATMYWTCNTCTVLNQPNGSGQATMSCSVCGSPRPLSNEIYYEGTKQKHNREFNPYSEDEHPYPDELWAINLLKDVILYYYPPEKPMEYTLLLPEKVLNKNANSIHLIGLANSDKTNATWKEFIVYKHINVLHVYNLLSHGRKMYRSLIFSTSSTLSLASLAGDDSGQVVPDFIRNAAGDLKEYRKPSSSLQIVRQSDSRREVLLPSRLLNGVIPSCLLENFRFWQDENDLTINGEPIDLTSQFFNFHLKITLNGTGAIISRLPVGEQLSNAQRTAISLLRSTSTNSNHSDMVEDASQDVALRLPLLNLGFSNEVASLGLRMANNDVSAAACWLLDENNAGLVEAVDSKGSAGGGDGVSDPLAPPPLKRSSSHDFRIKTLVEEGFPKEAATYALSMFKGERSCQALARTWLMDSRNESEVQRILGKNAPTLRGISNISSGGENNNDSTKIKVNNIIDNVKPRKSHPESKLVDTLEVLNNSSESAFIKILKSLCRLEDLSHILVWCNKNDDHSNNEGKMNNNTFNNLLSIDQIDLPRLKMKLKPKKNKNGNIHLYLLDQDGWYITDSISTSYHNNKSLLNILKGTSNSIFIENDSGEIQLLMANHDCCRPVSSKLPFTTNLVFYRNSVTWMEVMSRRYYLYPIHTSKTFLDTTSLASRLYLILLKFLRRDYVGAVKLINVIAIDVLFTSEEQWVFNLIQQRTLDDHHPDAHACRLKLLLAVHLFSDNEIQWETHVECDQYLLKIENVSADCRLTEDEELDVLSLSKQGTPRIKNRLRLLAGKKRNKMMTANSEMNYETKGDDENNIVVEGGNPRVGGQPWWKLGTYSANHVEHRTRTTNSFLQYKDPESKVSS
jgi:thiol-disulfide isomerase/thioredoxin